MSCRFVRTTALPKREPWRSRITGHGDESPTALVENPANWRRHPKRQADALAGVLSEVGWVQDVIVNRQTGHLVDGHLRVALAVERKEPTIPVVYVDLSEAEEALILATLDPLSAMAETDAAKLRGLLDEVSTGEAAVQEMLAGMAEVVLTEPIPDIPGYDAPPTAHRLIILCDDAEQVQELADALGLRLKANVVAYPFADVTLPDG